MHQLQPQAVPSQRAGPALVLRRDLQAHLQLRHQRPLQNVGGEQRAEVLHRE